jgi:hypothetical protein
MLGMTESQELELPRDRKDPIEGYGPAKAFVAQAVDRGDGTFNAIWASPGLIPDYVYEGKDPEIFHHPELAEAKARKVMFDALNSRAPAARRAYVPNQPGQRQDVTFEKMSAAEFAQALALAEITKPEMAFLWGTRPDRVDGWTVGKDNPPFPMWWVLHLLRDPTVFDRVMNIAEQHVTDRRT